MSKLEPTWGRSCFYYIPTGSWGKVANLLGRSSQMHQRLAQFAGKAVGALLLQHEWDKNDTQTAKRIAPDIKKWLIEQVPKIEFIWCRGGRANQASHSS